MKWIKRLKEQIMNYLPLVGLASHDFRDLRNEVDFVWDSMKTSTKKFPEVKFRYCTSLEGFRNVIEVDHATKIGPCKIRS